MIRRSLLDQRIRDVAIVLALLALCALAVLLWGQQ